MYTSKELNKYNEKYMISFLKNKNIIVQKRMLFMLESFMNLIDNFEYHTMFHRIEILDSYYDRDFFINTPFFRTFGFYAIGIVRKNNVFFSSEELAPLWSPKKEKIIKSLKLPEDLFNLEYEKFKFGIHLHTRRCLSRKNYSKKYGITLYKVQKVEDFGFQCNLYDFGEYIQKAKLTPGHVTIEEFSPEFKLFIKDSKIIRKYFTKKDKNQKV